MALGKSLCEQDEPNRELPARDYPPCPARKIPRKPRQIINPLLTKPFGSRWLDIDKSKRDIDFVLFCELMDLDSVSVYKLAKKTISSHLDLMLGE